jgi:hypothetical protein
VTQAAGWFSDPYGRFEQRYWNGTSWTEHVSTGGSQSVDPLGTSTVIPIVTPASVFSSDQAAVVSSAQPVVATATKQQPRHFLDSLGDEGRSRPAPRLSIALAGGGGALVALGIAAAIFGDSGSRGSAFGAAVVILGAALAIRFVVDGQPDLRSAAVGAGVVGLVVLGLAIANDDVGEAWASLVVGLLFLAAWVLPGFRGRNLMLGLGTLQLVAALGEATSSNSPSDGILSDLPFDANVGDQGAVLLLAAAALLGLVWWLDRAGYRGVGTGLVVPALASAFVGAAEVADGIDNAGGALLVLAVGLVVCVIGSHGDRRATTWWGAVLATAGVVGFFYTTMKPDSVSSIAGMLVISGALLIGGPAVARAIRASQNKDQSAPAAPSGSGALPPPTL